MKMYRTMLKCAASHCAFRFRCLVASCLSEPLDVPRELTTLEVLEKCKVVDGDGFSHHRLPQPQTSHAAEVDVESPWRGPCAWCWKHQAGAWNAPATAPESLRLYRYEGSRRYRLKGVTGSEKHILTLLADSCLTGRLESLRKGNLGTGPRAKRVGKARRAAQASAEGASNLRVSFPVTLPVLFLLCINYIKIRIYRYREKKHRKRDGTSARTT